LLKRFIDIHARITQTVTLPVESYALKHLARWVGFQWRNPTANGAQCVCWYEDWINTGNQHYVDEILAYNEDDCRATYLVKDWLLQFLTQIPDVD
jgi:predicted RecB family nuclease